MGDREDAAFNNKVWRKFSVRWVGKFDCESFWTANSVQFPWGYAISGLIWPK
jgi:hypothetical protein